MKIIKAKPIIIILAAIMGASVIGCKQAKKESDSEEMETVKTEQSNFEIEESVFGTLPDGREVKKIAMSNEAGMEVDVITLGGIITRWTAPDKNGFYDDVVIGFDSLEQYLEPNPFFGALIGRYGNRIAKGKFTLDGKEYTLATNDGANHLHGGEKGFDKVLWDAKAEKTADGAQLVLTYTSPDGEEGYPGKLDVTVTYTLTADNALDIQYEAVTDKPTIVNLTQHTYFNLSGMLTKPVLDHELVLDADAFLPVDGGLIPTGELQPVAGTPFDFTKGKLIGKEIEAENEQLKLGGGYDHCWVLNNAEDGFRLVGSAYHGKTGRYMEVYTDEPGIQFYSGNFLDGTLPAKVGGTYGKRSGFCLETQHYPDTPNQEGFPSVQLNPGEKYSTRTMYKLSTK
ncbi:aldose epimerase family protein [Flagellimonas zhangzhouensis]|uniref:Aldose 1-epimerase n=1 Tax=Flagellimonas zhangzhouensis TaxID=1073328 RepID=A0A1H2QC01_9FLAO|nr:aldose epimerase family protein [Allomuricauda zhangzhouensis]SDQ51221.1 aldose 1-epimerase [Allomuricauda zhangzhouensis]SDW04652.1 aldose 1-epimerase [Allomuricauda zhangzhouensis]